MAENGKTPSRLVFAVNGERFELSSVDPSTTLLQFLRTQTPFKSVKLGCGEGGCGACVVLISKYDPVLDQVDDFTASSCLTLLCSIHGCSITTSDGLGNSKDGFHPIHERIAGFHASQCGFCTPGMCVSLYGALVNAEKANRPEAPSGFSKLTVDEAERAIAGNLCRCTGYRPLADASKSFAANVDMEDLGLNAFWKKGDNNEVKLSRLPRYEPDHKKSRFPTFLKKEIMPDVFLPSEKQSWHSPTSLMELQSLLRSNQVDGIRIKLVVSNTSAGYYKETETYDKYINLKGIPELSKIQKDATGIEIGAVVPISKAIEALKRDGRPDFLSDFEMVLGKVANHMNKIASGFIRNTASVGGNLMMAQKRHFPSDIATILLSVDSSVHMMTGTKFEWLKLEEFLGRPPLGLESVLLSIKIPSWESNSRSKVLFETFRAAPRPIGNALPFLNAAFFAEISPCNDSNDTVIDVCRLSLGAYGTKHAIRARNVEEYLVGTPLSVSILYEAVKLITAAVVPEDGTSRIAYRSSLAAGFLFKFFNPLIDSPGKLSNGYINGYSGKEVQHEKVPTLLSSGKQLLQSGSEYRPIGEPVIKAGAALQASGEAVYVDDIPSPTNCLHGTFIYSTKPLARIKGIKLEPALQQEGVRGIISSKDIPTGGNNYGSKTIFGLEPLFADDTAGCVGDRLAFVVADTQKLADKAANTAIVDYDIENLEPPILSVEDAVKRSSFWEVHSSLHPANGDISKGMAEADHKILSSEIKLGSQYYFYMETQTALAIPDEDNCMVVYTSSQSPEFTHNTIASCLGIPENNVRIITRRVGGGFGGKFIRAISAATSCALAAKKLRRPVRMYLNRKADMIMSGGRHPMKITYDVGFKTNGKITALELKILINAGIYADVSKLIPHTMLGTLNKYDWGVLSYDVKVCKTNHPSRSAMRAPGEVQGSFIAEAIIEHVASALSMDVDYVRSVNLHTYTSLCSYHGDCSGELHEYTLPSIWNQVAVSANFDQRSEMMKDFNRINIWKKRGISRVPIVYPVNVRPTPGKVSILGDGSVVVEVGGTELGQGLWTKVKQMAAYGLNAIYSGESGDLLDKVRVVQADTLSLTQGGFTAGSTTSESSCEAVRLSCIALVERLMPLKTRLEEKSGSISWETLILQAQMEAIHLSATSYFVPGTASMNYLNYGAAVSEVEIDLLTGETTVLQTDIVYDCGQSLNPAVDLGQIEGAFVMGLGFFMQEEYVNNDDGLVLTDSTWNYKIPTLDTIPKQFNVEIINSEHHHQRILSSKASGEPPLLLSVSVHCATRAAIKEARKQLLSWRKTDEADSAFQLEVPATLPVVKELSGLDIVETYLKWKTGK